MFKKITFAWFLHCITDTRCAFAICHLHMSFAVGGVDLFTFRMHYLAHRAAQACTFD